MNLPLQKKTTVSEENYAGMLQKCLDVWTVLTRRKTIDSKTLSDSKLRRKLSLIDLLGFGVGGSIGLGVFAVLPFVIRNEAGPSTVLSISFAALGAILSDDVLSINNPNFADYLSRIYPSELEVKETKETNNSASCLDIILSYETDGNMNTSVYDKLDDFSFSITHFPFLSSNIPSSPAYGMHISQLIRYARVSSKYTDFALRARRLSDKLLSQGYVFDRLTSSLRKFYDPYDP
ncbi:hypothetical protein FSP39_022091 [Pinctada imbricata]|uniref:Uncharacterized protein n=1 Tax=Pinctada imbricata TaxID=66713 RepID=A0AA89C1T4_PINIB|nr:hypothetical protein FSP39_022091 [Pinctada imbricata]